MSGKKDKEGEVSDEEFERIFGDGEKNNGQSKEEPEPVIENAK